MLASDRRVVDIIENIEGELRIVPREVPQELAGGNAPFSFTLYALQHFRRLFRVFIHLRADSGSDFAQFVASSLAECGPTLSSSIVAKRAAAASGSVFAQTAKIWPMTQSPYPPCEVSRSARSQAIDGSCFASSPSMAAPALWRSFLFGIFSNSSIARSGSSCANAETKMWEESCWNERDLQVLTNSTAAAGSTWIQRSNLGRPPFPGIRLRCRFRLRTASNDSSPTGRTVKQNNSYGVPRLKSHPKSTRPGGRVPSCWDARGPTLGPWDAYALACGRSRPACLPGWRRTWQPSF